jgi:hypothetical protein
MGDKRWRATCVAVRFCRFAGRAETRHATDGAIATRAWRALQVFWLEPIKK